MLDMIDMAKQMAGTRGHACPADIDLLVKVMRKLPKNAVVIQLGAGSGTMTLAVLGARPKARMWSVDIDRQSLHWEKVAMDNCGFPSDRVGVLSKSVPAARRYDGPLIDLLIVDADHTYKGVLADLKAWKTHFKPDCWVFVHDYDGSCAPAQYPGVEKAAKKFFRVKYTFKAGWSAVWHLKGEDHDK